MCWRTIRKSIDYCRLKVALIGDKNAIKKLWLLKFDNATGYTHGEVIVDLITTIGEIEYIKAISTLNKEQKNLILSYILILSCIKVGLEYRNNPSVKGKILKIPFLICILF